MRYSLLASGSNGNACLVEAGGHRLLVDLGIGPRVLGWRLEPLGLKPADITDLLLTHEHGDHVGGIEGLIKRQPALRIHASRGTTKNLRGDRWAPARDRAERLRAWRRVRIGPFDVLPLPTSHDSAEPLGYRLEAGGAALGYLTDLGHFDDRLADALRGVSALVIESNHCPEMLARGSYPVQLKRRILGPRGHLSNQQCRAALETLAGGGLEQVTLAHLSADNNSPAVALEATRDPGGLPGVTSWAVGSRQEALPAATIPGSEPADVPPAAGPEDQLVLGFE